MRIFRGVLALLLSLAVLHCILGCAPRTVTHSIWIETNPDGTRTTTERYHYNKPGESPW